MRILSIFSIVLILPALTACPAKNSPRQEHEGKKAYTAPKAPVDETVEAKDFNEYDLQAGYAALKGDKTQLLNVVLIPLSVYVLNQKFIGDPKYRTPRLTQMINIFNT